MGRQAPWGDRLTGRDKSAPEDGGSRQSRSTTAGFITGDKPASAPGTQRTECGGRLSRADNYCRPVLPFGRLPAKSTQVSSPSILVADLRAPVHTFLNEQLLCLVCVHSSPCAAVVPLHRRGSAHRRPGAGMSGCRYRCFLPSIKTGFQRLHMCGGSRCMSAHVSFSHSMDTCNTCALLCVTWLHGCSLSQGSSDLRLVLCPQD